MPDYQVVVTTSGDPILEHHTTGGGGGAGSGTGLPGYTMASGTVPTNGTTDARSALFTLFNTTIPNIGVGRQQVYLQSGEVVYVASSITIPNWIRLVFLGGVLKPASGAVITIAHEFDAGPNQLFDTSLGGSVVFGAPMTAEPAWWNADRTGTVGATVAFQSAVNAGANALASDNFLRPGTYLTDGYHQAFGTQYGRAMYRGAGMGVSVLKNPTARPNGSPEWEGQLTFYGGAQYAPGKVTIRDLDFQGAGSTDYTTHLIIDQFENFHLENLWFSNNGIESVRSLSGTDIRRVTVQNCHWRNTGLARGAACMNVGASEFIMTGCSMVGSNIGMETGASFTEVAHCIVKDMGQWGFMLFSTWSGYFDSLTGAETHTYNGSIKSCQFINIPDRAILMPDFTGHANADPAHPTPTFLKGNKGQVTISGNLFDRVSTAVWGGADYLGPIDFHDNVIAGQYVGAFGAGQSYAMASLAGTWNIHHNVFCVGSGLGFSGLWGDSITGVGSNQARHTLSDNTIIDRPCNSTMFNMTQDALVSQNRFLENTPTSISSNTNAMYRWHDDNNNQIATLPAQDWCWYDVDHTISMAKEPSRIPLAADVIPPNMVFKPGDTLIARFPGAWNVKRCLTGGTTSTTALSMTGTGTSGTNTMTMNTVAGLAVYQWVNVPSVGAITPKQVTLISPTTKVVTFATNLEANVTAAAVQYVNPTWQTDGGSGGGSAITSVFGRVGVVTAQANDYTYAQLASKPTTLSGFGLTTDFNTQGDARYAALSHTHSGAAITSGTVGTAYLGSGTASASNFLRGDGSWAAIADSNVSVTAPYGAGSSGTGLTLTWTLARQFQTETLTANATTTIAGIPSGGSLRVRVFQNATTAYTHSFAVSGLGTLFWDGNTTPTMTATLGKFDDYVFTYDGTRTDAARVRTAVG